MSGWWIGRPRLICLDELDINRVPTQDRFGSLLMAIGSHVMGKLIVTDPDCAWRSNHQRGAAQWVRVQSHLIPAVHTVQGEVFNIQRITFREGFEELW